MKVLEFFSVILLVGLHSLAQVCPPGEVLCEGTQDECIKEEYVCDRQWIDCSNDWDEMNCCEANEFKCPNTTICIPNYYVCDYKVDCPGEEDEQGCPPCPGFSCNDGTCIPDYWVCDYEVDCPDGEDEVGCPPCPGFSCDDGACLPGSWVCDGYPDCEGGEDEPPTCPECDGFECSDGYCIPSAWVCDGEQDCSNDEEDCGCKGFECDDGVCIPSQWVCDGVVDCWDDSDEKNCTTSSSIPLRKGIPVQKQVQAGNRVPMTLTLKQLAKRKEKKARKLRREEKDLMTCSRRSSHIPPTRK